MCARTSLSTADLPSIHIRPQNDGSIRSWLRMDGTVDNTEVGRLATPEQCMSATVSHTVMTTRTHFVFCISRSHVGLFGGRSCKMWVYWIGLVPGTSVYYISPVCFHSPCIGRAWSSTSGSWISQLGTNLPWMKDSRIPSSLCYCMLCPMQMEGILSLQLAGSFADWSQQHSPSNESPLASGIDIYFLNLTMCLWGWYY